MSYDISLVDPTDGTTLLLPEAHHMRGGTYAVGGTRTAELNITYNYGGHFRNAMGTEGIRTIYGMTGADSVPVLRAAIAKMSPDDRREDDYWAPTEGNARAALEQVLWLAEQLPRGVWEGD